MAEPSIYVQDDAGANGASDTGGSTATGNNLSVNGIPFKVDLTDLLEKAKKARQEGKTTILLTPEEQDKLKNSLNPKPATATQTSSGTSLLTYVLIVGLLFVIFKPKNNKSKNGNA